MLKAFKYSILPTTAQQDLINKHIGCSRFVYNLALETKKVAFESGKINLTRFDLINQLPGLKEECSWLMEVNSQCLQQSVSNLDAAFVSFFKGKSDYPKFKKKSKSRSFTTPQGVTIENGKLSIPKFREGIKIILHRGIKGVIKKATISRTATNKYFVSILCETGEVKKEKAIILKDSTVGIDLGIKTFLVSSNGLEIENPKFLKNAQSRIKFIQRKYSKNKSKRTLRKLSALHEKVANCRKDFLHKTSSELIKNHDSIAIEDLPVSNMLKNRDLAKAISDAGWSMFINMLQYKAEWYGKNILQIGRFEPSSKTCSSCGNIHSELKLKDREWACNSCGELLNRDLNAAKNIKAFALKKYSSVGYRHKIDASCQH